MSSKQTKTKAVNHVTEDVINQGLEHSGDIGQSKWHDQVLKVSQGGVECHLPLVSITDSDQVVCVTQVQFGEDD